MKKYTILKHFHYSNYIPNIVKIKDKIILSYNVKFEESCRYSINEKSCVNKLFGACFGLLGVHKYSYRFGWTYDNNKINIWKYIYKDGINKVNKEIITNVNLNKSHKFTITLIKNTENNQEYFINYYIDDVLISRDTIKSSKKYLLTLGPYFGGNTRCPHKMIIDMKRFT